MSSDLSTVHELVSDLIKLPQTPVGWARFRLRPEQIEFFHTHGYLAGIKILTGEQVERLRLELHELTNPAHPQHELFYEFHSNESSEPTHVLFHALGAWRIAPGFHDLLWHPACTVPAAQCASGTINSSANPPATAAWSLGIKTIHTGRAHVRAHTSLAGSA